MGGRVTAGAAGAIVSSASVDKERIVNYNLADVCLADSPQSSSDILASVFLVGWGGLNTSKAYAGLCRVFNVIRSTIKKMATSNNKPPYKYVFV